MNKTGTFHTYPSSWHFGVDPEGRLPVASAHEQQMALGIQEEDHAQQAAVVDANPVSDVMLQQFPHPVDSLPLGFGKHKGKTPLQVAMAYPDYLVWCAAKGIATGSSELIAHCQRVVERSGQPQPRGHLKYGRYR